MHLPGELFEELSRAHRQRWTHADELLALILEKLDELVLVTDSRWRTFLNPKGFHPRMGKPFRYPRPVQPAPARKSTIAEIRAFFKR